MRIETDAIGSLEIEQEALYGIHSLRAKLNFPNHSPFHIEWFKALGLVKLAAYRTIANFNKAVEIANPGKLKMLKTISPNIVDALIESATEISSGQYFNHFIVPAIQGGAGTSINMNVNEIITNITLIKLNSSPGKYSLVDPVEQANQYQSTNDVVPTALTVAAMQLLVKLEKAVNEMRSSVEQLEKKYRDDLRIGYTQMQQAVPTSFGRFFGAFNEAFSRDWWRISKCLERIKTVNLGGGAIGSGIAIPRFYIIEVVNELRKLTALPLAQNENLNDATSNLDSWVEIHGILKAHAVNLEKLANDIRLLASDIAGNEITLPARQVGSSIMPGKINPVICEFIISTTHKIYANDIQITQLAAMGTLELNAYLPCIGHAILDSIKSLIAANQTLNSNLLNDLTINTKKASDRLFNSPAICTALSPIIGYHEALKLAKTMAAQNVSIFEANNKLQVLDNHTLGKYLQPGFLLQKGFSINDIL